MPALSFPSVPAVPTADMDFNVSDLQAHTLFDTVGRCAQAQTNRGVVESSISEASFGRPNLVTKDAIPTTPSEHEEGTIPNFGQSAHAHGEEPRTPPPFEIFHGESDDTNAHVFQRWQSLRRVSTRSLNKARHPGKIVVGDSGQPSLEPEDPENYDQDELKEEDSSVASSFDMLQTDLHLLDEKMDILIEVMFKNLKYSKAIYMSSKKSLTGPGHETGTVAKVRFEIQPSQEPGELPKAATRERLATRKCSLAEQKINNMLDLTRHITLHNDKSTWKQIGAFIWRSMEDRTSSKAAAGYFIGINFFLLFSIAFAIFDVMSDSGSGSTSTFERGHAMTLALIIEIYFTLEIGLRFWVCPSRRLFWCNGFNIIDAVSALPIVLRLIVLLAKPSSDGVYALMCMVPVLRLMKLLRRFETFHLLASAFRSSAEALPSILFTLMIVTLFFAAIITYCEPRSNIASYPDAVWYVIITLVGLAPAFPVPVTTAGKVWTVVLILCGTLYMAIPIGIVGAAFSHVWEERQRLLILQRMRSCVERAGVSPEDLQTMFTLLDEDADGMLDFSEFASMLEVMQIDVQENFAIQVFESFDSDCEGSIDFHELFQGLFPHARWLFRQPNTVPEGTAVGLGRSGSLESGQTKGSVGGSMPIEEYMPITTKSSVEMWKNVGRHTIKNRGKPKRSASDLSKAAKRLARSASSMQS